MTLVIGVWWAGPGGWPLGPSLLPTETPGVLRGTGAKVCEDSQGLQTLLEASNTSLTLCAFESRRKLLKPTKNIHRSLTPREPDKLLGKGSP